ncbi:AAA family ATPase [Arenibacter sp. BSSL-BM3]|uniref:AAA family ATPase n=1 Tax=Arenibacter arenosicollis TaxID=2762274 RepID=A0ABR7QTF0_9FLAO|nr:AAA family ATPase [Arenibacter arenosicollis]MBC8770441.1 AAA family ATPase [Arenibacter arenosicollis]
MKNNTDKPQNKEAFVETVKSEINNHEAKLTTHTSCFIVKTANDWIEEAKSRPIPNMLFDAFWFEKEVCILFADTNVGKSILAVQIADSISRGVGIDGFTLESGPQKVVYFDFELSDKQFEKRYSDNYKDHYSFHPNFLRAEINSDTDKPKGFATFEDYICHAIEQLVLNRSAEVLIIDNITFLRNDNEKAKDALMLMKHLKAIGRKHDLSILVLAHTPKRNPSSPLSKNDLSGSKMLINFCDSSFAIGDSSGLPSYRYIKQIKQRNTEHIYHSGNVVVCNIVNHHNFLCFEFVEYDDEQSHLMTYSLSDVEERNSKVLELKENGLANTVIATQLGVSEGTIRNILKKSGK